MTGRVRRERNQTRPRTSWKRRRRRFTTIGLTAFATVVSALVARYLPFPNRVVLAAAVMVPHLTAAGPTALVFFVIARRWVLATGAAIVTAVVVATQVPLFRADKVPTGGSELRVMTVNLMLGTAPADAVVKSAQTRADVLAVQELTSAELDRLSTAGLDKTFPYRVVDPKPGAFGIGLWSRYPVTQKRSIEGYRTPLLAAQVRITGVATDTTIVVVHPRNPWHIDDWHHDIRRLPTTLREIAEWAGAGPVIVAGDFNSTPDTRPFRDLLRDGYRSAAEQAGAGFAATFPVGVPWIPPLFAIDHILTLRCAAVSAETVTIRGSDHRALAAIIRIPQR